MAGVSYDPAGNQTSYDGLTLEYDAEGRNTKVKSNNLDYVIFSYDGEGRRVKKTSGNDVTYYIYNALGQLAAEYSNGSAAAGTSYLFTDMLGSVRTITDKNGNIEKCYDYLPFGRLLGPSDNGRNAAPCYSAPETKVDEKFTGQKRDKETGLDYFGARYFSAPLGRFTSPDKPLLDQHRVDPQSWNLYAYARNNPLKYIDPTGEMIELLGEDEEERKKALEVLRNAVGGKAAGLLGIKSVDGKYMVDIKGDMDDFRKLGDAANRLAGLVTHEDTLEFGLTNRDLSDKGGAVTFKPGGDGNNENVRVLVNPDQMNIATRNLSPNASYLSAWRWGGQDGPRSERWSVRPVTPEIATWHEFGHATGYLNSGWFSQKFSGFPNKEALDWENRMREQIYGTFGPNNAPRIKH
jgi:RHS repeat-associated protein